MADILNHQVVDFIEKKTSKNIKKALLVLLLPIMLQKLQLFTV